MRSPCTVIRSPVGAEAGAGRGRARGPRAPAINTFQGSSRFVASRAEPASPGTRPRPHRPARRRREGGRHQTGREDAPAKKKVAEKPNAAAAGVRVALEPVQQLTTAKAIGPPPIAILGYGRQHLSVPLQPKSLFDLGTENQRGRVCQTLGTPMQTHKLTLACDGRQAAFGWLDAADIPDVTMGADKTAFGDQRAFLY